MSSITSNIHKVVIIGSGPAAHTAAIYAGRAKLNPILYEGFMAGGIAPGGQLTTTTEVENFPGFPKGISGTDLMDGMRLQSINCGTQIITETIAKVDLSSRPFKLWNEDGQEVRTHALILAMGATAKRLHIENEDTYWNKGMSACAVCDGPAPIFKNKPLAVVGGGDSACEEANYLTKYASKVYMLVRRDKLRASKTMQLRAMNNAKIEILWNVVPVKANGGPDNLLSSVTLKSTHPDTPDKTHDLLVNGFFYAIGHLPNTGCLKAADNTAYQVDTDQDGYIVNSKPGSSLTSVPGVFACGDVADKYYRQAITAAGSGCKAALDAEHYLESIELTHDVSAK